MDRDQPCSDFAAGRHASEGPVLASLLPLAMCLQVSLTLSSTPLTDGLNLLTGGRTRVSNQSWHTLTFEFCTGIGTCDPHLEGPRRSTGMTALCSFPSAINHRWESQRSRAHRTVCSRPRSVSGRNSLLNWMISVLPSMGDTFADMSSFGLVGFGLSRSATVCGRPPADRCVWPTSRMNLL